MGLKCSLLGHEYGEPETEREREERGDEVVETVRTVEYCERCGTERVVSENTEVRSVRQAPESLADEPDESDTDADADEGTETGDSGLSSAVERVENDAEIDVESAAAAEAEIDDGGIDVDENASPAEDDAVILTDDGEEVTPERERGEWPSSEDTREGDRPDAETAEPEDVEDDAAVIGSETGSADDEDASTGDEDDAVFIDETVSAEDDDGASAAWPDQDGEDEGFAAEPATAGGTDVSFGGGITPDEQSERGESESGEDEEEIDPRGGIASAGPIETDRGSESANTDGDELVCPECGERTAVSGSSLRAGDICPECHRGYLAEAPESA